MLVESQNITPKSTAQLRGAITAGVSNIRHVITHIPHLVLTRVMRDIYSCPSSTTKIVVGRRPTQVFRTRHHSIIRLGPPTNHRETLGAEFT